MQIDLIADPAAFGRLRDNWNAVYAADPAAQLFLSWDWLSGWLPQLQGPWLILAAREDKSPAGRYCAFFPLRMETRFDESGRFVNELKMAGNHAADYTGLICTPEAEGRVVAAFGRYLKQQLHWARLHLDNFSSGRTRLNHLLAHFPKAGFATTEVDRVSKVDGIDNNVCPCVDLPGDWDAYLATLSANTRQKLRRVLRLIDAGDEFRVTHATRETVERDLDGLLRYWAIKWRPRKGDLVDGLVRSNRNMLLRSFERGLLFLPVLWQGERPLAALATLVDANKRSWLFYMTGRDETFDGPPPGLILHGHSIRFAIANGVSRYDFLRGNERYKYSFGPRETRIACFTVATRDGRNLGNRFDPWVVPDVLKEATALHQTGKLAEAERGYQQILAVAPRHPDALHRLGQLLTTRQRHLEAMRVFKLLTQVKPEATKAWLCLAEACERSERHEEAVKAYQELLALSPGATSISDRLDQVLSRTGREGAAATEQAADRTAHSDARSQVDTPVFS